MGIGYWGLGIGDWGWWLGSYGNNLNLTEDKYFSIVEFEIFHVKITS